MGIQIIPQAVIMLLFRFINQVFGIKLHFFGEQLSLNGSEKYEKFTTQWGNKINLN